METDEKAREVLGIKQDQWVIGFNDEELALLKSALRTHAELSRKLADKVEQTG